MKRLAIALLALLAGITAMAQRKIIIHLTDGTKIEKQVWEVKDITFGPGEVVATPTVAEAVDLGLSVKWASTNFGAEAPEQPGYYIGWGDVSGLNTSANLSYFPIANPTSGIVAGKYDIVHNLWASDWRMPTDGELLELVNKCDWQWDITRNGYIVKSRTNSNSIFLPLTGYRSGTEKTDVTTKGYYWSGSLGTQQVDLAQALVFDNVSTGTMTEQARYIGAAIRPVFGAYADAVAVGSSQVTSVTTNTANIQVIFTGDVENATTFGVCYATDAKSLDPDNGNKAETTSLDANGSASFTISNLKPGTDYYYAPYIIYKGHRVQADGVKFTTQVKFPVPEMVDMGLSVKWAKWNFGATEETGYGNYVAWSDPTGENASTTLSDYYSATVNISGTSYDCTTQAWGGQWHMPTKAEFDELYALPHESVTRNGVKGVEFTAKNGNKLFLPWAGYKNAKGLHDAGGLGVYWTGDYVSLDYGLAAEIGIVSVSYTSDEKSLHYPIRAVYGDIIDANNPKPEEGLTDAGKAATTVDLGLTVLWGTANLGATSETDNGDYFAWGETAPKSEYSLNTYAYYSNGAYTVSSIGTNISGTANDAARVIYGGKWRMPTEVEVDELIDGCTWESTSTYIKGTSKSNGKTIIIPRSGLISGTNQISVGKQVTFWTGNYDISSYHAEDYWAIMGVCSQLPLYTGGNYIYKGLPIRPVKSK